MKLPSILLAALCVASACATAPAGAPATEIVGPAPWQGPLADRMNHRDYGPTTPALRVLRGRTPLVHLARRPARESATEPDYEVAVFEDGTMVYEGHRCVEIGGVVIARLGTEPLTQLEDLLAALCVDIDGSRDGELCEDAVTLRVACSSGTRVQSGSDHCRKDEPAGRRIEALRTALLESLALDAWIGVPARRQACSTGARELAPRELARVLAPG